MKRLAVFVACLALTSVGPSLAVAQSSPSQPNYPTNTAQGNVKSVPGSQCMYYNPSLGYAVPCSTDNPLPTTITAGSTTIGNVGVVNGANQAAVKAASTAPVAADPALVVTENPLSPTTTGQAAIISAISAAALTPPLQTYPKNGIPISCTAGVGNLVTLTGATCSNGVLTFTAANQVAIIDLGVDGSAGYGMTVAGTFTGLALRMQYSANSAGTFSNSGLISTVNSEVNGTISSVTSTGNYFGCHQSRYLQITPTALSTGSATVQPVLMNAAPTCATVAQNGQNAATPIFAAPVANVSGGYTYTNVTSATTTTVKSGAGFFKRVTINTCVASATITLYDNTAASGTKIGTLTCPSSLTSEVPTFVDFEAAFATGLTAVTSGATDLTFLTK